MSSRGQTTVPSMPRVRPEAQRSSSGSTQTPNTTRPPLPPAPPLLPLPSPRPSKPHPAACTPPSEWQRTREVRSRRTPPTLYLVKQDSLSSPTPPETSPPPSPPSPPPPAAAAPPATARGGRQPWRRRELAHSQTTASRGAAPRSAGRPHAPPTPAAPVRQQAAPAASPGGGRIGSRGTTYASWTSSSLPSCLVTTSSTTRPALWWTGSAEGFGDAQLFVAPPRTLASLSPPPGGSSASNISHVAQPGSWHEKRSPW